mmetsp:Transcript_13337/g.22506  ORF Transcript_13337/g.22506 Transcript_13337/m.22506 type:complete len:339 (+) Transcript_13337:439-1455(+)
MRALLSSFSRPSSFLMLFSCSNRKYRRWSFEIFSSTCLPMCCCSFTRSSSALSSASVIAARCGTSRASSTFCSLSPSAVVRDAPTSARRELFSKSPPNWMKSFSCSLCSGFAFTRSLMVDTISIVVALSTSSLAYFASLRCTMSTLSASPASPLTVDRRRMRRWPYSISVVGLSIASSSSEGFVMCRTCAKVPISNRCEAASSGSSLLLYLSSSVSSSMTFSRSNCRNVPTYAWDPLCSSISFSSLMIDSSVTGTFITIPGRSGRRVSGIAITLSWRRLDVVTSSFEDNPSDSFPAAFLAVALMLFHNRSAKLSLPPPLPEPSDVKEANLARTFAAPN